MKYQYLIIFFLFTLCSTKKEGSGVISDFSSPAKEMASLPHLIKGEDSNLYLSWVEKGDSNWVEFKYSVLNGSKWSEPELIARGNNWFVNWADYPMIAVDREGNKMAHYLVKSTGGTYSYDVNVVIKPVTENSWSHPIIPHKDGTPTEHGFVTIIPQNDGTFLLSWLDGRNTGGGEHSEESHGSGDAMTIRTATLDMQANLTNEEELDSRVCDCCQTSGAMISSGPVIVYRDRSMNEIRDVSFVKKVNNQWTTPQSVANDNWNIAGCPVNGPRLAALKDQFAVAWFTAANDTPTVKLAFGNEESFNEPIIIDDGMPIGRVDIILLDQQTALVSWMMNQDEKTVINVRTVKKDGTLGKITTVAETNNSRGSGFPQMEKMGNQVYFAWTNLQEEGSSILMKTFSLD